MGEGGEATTANPFITGSITNPIITVSASATATLPQPIATSAFSLPELTVLGSASALVPQPIINGNIPLEVLTVSASGTVTLPQPIATGAFSLSLTVNGFATVTGLDLIIDPKTDIQQVLLSANITQEFLSSNIIYN